MNNHPIGIIDSGIGGVSVWNEIVARLPHESTIYLCDAKNLPYGEKSEEEVYSLAKRLLEYLIRKEVKLIVIACNTITVSALDKLRADFPTIPIVGTVPVVKSAAAYSKNKRIGVLSTKRTAESSYQKNLIAQFASDCEVLNLGTNELVPMVESGVVDRKVLRQELQPFIKAQIDTLALGCTHFPFLEHEIQAILGKNVHILDSGEAVARQVKRILEQEHMLHNASDSTHLFFTTGDTQQFTTAIQRLVESKLHGRIQAEQISL